MPDENANKPGKGFLGWLGRQIGHVKGAISRDVTTPKVVYKKTTVQESSLPDRPDEKLRRTVVDEVIRDEKKLPS